MYPEAKIELKECATKKLSVMNCDVINNYITNELFPKVYLTYLTDQPNDNSPSLHGFLFYFGLKQNCSESTTWWWLTHLGLITTKRKNIILEAWNWGESDLSWQIFQIWITFLSLGPVIQRWCQKMELKNDLFENTFYEYEDKDKKRKENIM